MHRVRNVPLNANSVITLARWAGTIYAWLNAEFPSDLSQEDPPRSSYLTVKYPDEYHLYTCEGPDGCECVLPNGRKPATGWSAWTTREQEQGADPLVVYLSSSGEGEEVCKVTISTEQMRNSCTICEVDPKQGTGHIESYPLGVLEEMARTLDVSQGEETVTGSLPTEGVRVECIPAERDDIKRGYKVHSEA